MVSNIVQLSAVELAKQIADGSISVVEVAKTFLAQIEDVDAKVQAFQHLNIEHVLAVANKMDEMRVSGRSLGPLHGVPVAVKDIIDTLDFPTENGLAADKGRRAEKDAFLVSKLRAAGALIIGKTVTTEAAYYQPSKTRNPHNLEHTPGGSSSGSAASVAAQMVPLSVGSQTNGSVIRPASFCGVVGFKPGYGQIARTGVLKLSSSLDQMGVFARSVEDAALLADVLIGADGEDESVPFAAHPRLQETAISKPPVRPALAFAPAPDWDEKANGDAKEAFSELVGAIGDVDNVPLPQVYAECMTMHGVVMATEMSRNLSKYGEGEAPISDHLKKIIEDGRAVSAHDYLAAKDWQYVFLSGLEEVFERYDAIITPASYGEAPKDLSHTGDPGACSLWTYCGLPAITLPLLMSENEMPIGVQLIGPRGEDGRLLRTANWLVNMLSSQEV